MFIISKTDFFNSAFYKKRDLRISTARTHIGISEINIFKPRKKHYFPNYLSD